MQVPASAITAGPENAAAGTSSSLFGALAGAPSAAKGKVPPFAAILAEQSVGTDTGKNIHAIVSGAGAGGADEALDAILSGIARVGPQALLSPPLKNPGDAQNDTPSGPSATSKNETKPVRRQTSSDSLSSASEKKQSSAAELIPSAVSAPVSVTIAQVIPAVIAAKGSHSILDASLPSANAPLLQRSFIPQSQSEHVAIAASTEVVRSEAAPPASDSVAHDLQPQAISSAKAQFTLSPVAAEAAETTVSIPESVAARRQVSSAAAILQASGSSDGLNYALAPFAGSAVQGAASPAALAPLSKSKTQEKANSDTVRGLSASVAASGVSSADSVPSHNVSLSIPQATRTADPVDSNPKQEPSVSEANTFQRLDSGGTPATLLHSSAHQIAVGVHDPSLGWLEVQTQSSAGHVSATLTAASTEAHASLAAQAPAITQYLADRNVSVHSVNVHTQADTQSGASSGGGQPQSDTGNARHEVSEHGSSGMEESRSSSLSQTGSEHTLQTRSSSYISIHA